MKKKDNFINKVAGFINKVANCIFNILTNKWVLLIVTIFVFILSLILFFDLENVNKECWVFINIIDPLCDIIKKSADDDFWGAYGDFFGGVLGALFALISVLYVAKTFREQQKETKAQRFNTIFSELLALYQSEVKNLEEFLSTEKNTIKDQFNSESSSFSKIRKDAYNSYMDFYAKNRGRIESYFRVLFRIFEFIDKSDLIDDSQRKEYAKIIRAQLKGDELFWLRYNALCIEGEDFIEYLNKYRVLKHLAVSEMLEFKIFWEKMSDEDKASMNMTYSDIYKTLKEVIEYCKDKECRINSDKYKVLVQFIKKSEIHISLIICNGQNNQYKNFDYIDNMEEEKRKEMLKYFAEEIFVYSNYKKYNKQKLDIECKDLQDQTGILCKINNKEGKQLKIKYRQKKNCYFRCMYYRIIS